MADLLKEYQRKGSLLVYEGEQAIGEYSFKSKGPVNQVVAQKILQNLKSHLSGVILSNCGILAHSKNLSPNNPYYRKELL